MSNTNVETITSTTDRIKLSLAVLVLIAGIVAYSMLDGQSGFIRVGSFIGSVILAALVAWWSEPGRRSISFTRDSYTEMKRVVWPQRKETTRMTGIVFAFVAAIAFFLWIVDKGFQWIVYGVLLGWN